MSDNPFFEVEYFQRYTIHNLPAWEEQIEGLLTIAQLIKVQPEYAVELVMTNHDDPQEIHFAWQGDGYNVVLTFPMDDFGWTHPLLLACEGLPYEELSEILRGICLEGKDTDSIPVIMNHFRDITSTVYEKDKPDDSCEE